MPPFFQFALHKKVVYLIKPVDQALRVARVEQPNFALLETWLPSQPSNQYRKFSHFNLQPCA